VLYWRSIPSRPLVCPDKVKIHLMQQGEAVDDS
jgi:hypothetical protein